MSMLVWYRDYLYRTFLVSISNGLKYQIWLACIPLMIAGFLPNGSWQIVFNLAGLTTVAWLAFICRIAWQAYCDHMDSEPFLTASTAGASLFPERSNLLSDQADLLLSNLVSVEEGL